jgi:hypothetical protein
MKRIRSLVLVATLGATLAATMAVPARAEGLVRLSLRSGHRLARHDATDAAKELLSRGYLVKSQATYDRAKAVLGSPEPAGTDGSTLVVASSTTTTVTPPKLIKGWYGQYDVSGSPPDATGAIGPTRVVQVVNQKFGVYSRTGSLYGSGTLAALTGDSGSLLTNPQVIWDAGTGRFYYSVLNFTYNVLDVGFSTTTTPTTLADWCRYQIDYGYGAYLPGFPRLGDTADFLLMGVNVFAPTGAYVRSDVDWLSKPPPGTTCPGSFRLGASAGLRNADGTPLFTPVPANQTDPSGQGWIVASRDATAGAGGDLSVLSVTTDPDGNAAIQTTASSIPVASYSLPPAAPQRGTTTYTLDTLDGRLTQAVSAIDPGHGSVSAVWTQHTVQSALGWSEVRWYELDPAALSVLQSGAASSSTLYTFNGAIAPDRLVNGINAKFGDSMVLNFNASSPTAYPSIQMLGKRSGVPQSAFVQVTRSGGMNIDFNCTPVCRWGDYAGAAPDPGASLTGLHGQVLSVNQWNVSSRTVTDVDWRSKIWLALA